jgi:hypothetical protein
LFPVFFLTVGQKVRGLYPIDNTALDVTVLVQSFDINECPISIVYCYWLYCPACISVFVNSAKSDLACKSVG